MGVGQSGPLNEFIDADGRNNSISQSGEQSCFALLDKGSDSRVCGMVSRVKHSRRRVAIALSSSITFEVFERQSGLPERFDLP
jgi:hypothetical protein